MQKGQILFVTKVYNFDHSGLLVSIPITKMRRWRQSCWKAQVAPEPQIGQMIARFVQKLPNCVKVKQCSLEEECATITLQSRMWNKQGNPRNENRMPVMKTGISLWELEHREILTVLFVGTWFLIMLASTMNIFLGYTLLFEIKLEWIGCAV